MAHEEPEQMERIPWADLLAQPRPPRPWLSYAVVGAVVLAGVWVVVNRRPTLAPAPTLAQQSTTPATVPEPLPAPEDEGSSLPLYTEADLMAPSPAVDLQAVVGRAEWFVLDYFTIDGAPDEQVLEPLPDEVRLLAESMPREPFSHIAWTRAVDVTEIEPGLFEVVVAFRQLTASGGDLYVRLPVKAVTVRLGARPDGTVAVLDVPAPAAIPLGRAPALVGLVEEEPSAPVAALALELGGAWGEEPEILSAARVGGEWRIVLMVGGSATGRWPLAVWLREGG